VTDRKGRRRAPKHARTRLGTKHTQPLPAFAAHRSGPPRITASARLDGADEVRHIEERRIEERRRFELGPDLGPGDGHDPSGEDWARAG